ncbi:hypothetical protein BC629DRAFT_1439073 [Irpex lacteus]|nr:hypothetical protein BC629DRAFT_1439073 [Irpex lacteus]
MNVSQNEAALVQLGGSAPTSYGDLTAMDPSFAQKPRDARNKPPKTDGHVKSAGTYYQGAETAETRSRMNLYPENYAMYDACWSGKLDTRRPIELACSIGVVFAVDYPIDQARSRVDRDALLDTDRPATDLVPPEVARGKRSRTVVRIDPHLRVTEQNPTGGPPKGWNMRLGRCNPLVEICNW